MMRRSNNMIDAIIAITLLSPCALFMAMGYFGKN